MCPRWGQHTRSGRQPAGGIAFDLAAPIDAEPIDTCATAQEGGPLGEAVGPLSLPSSDILYHEDWISAPLEAAGTVYVKVSYSSNGYAEANYQLIVDYE